MRAMRLFVDTSAWVALENRDDSYHDKAIDFWTELRGGRTPFRQILTSNYIMDEAMTLLGRRLGKGAAAGFWRKMQATKQVSILRVSEDIELKGFHLFLRGPHDLSFTDGTSFALMREEAIDTCFAFHHHFVDMGFAVVPEG
jgi:predicted nucleic acid-binding protein